MTDSRRDVDELLVEMASRGERDPLRPSELVRAVQARQRSGQLSKLGHDRARVAQVRTICRRLVRQNRHQPVVDLLLPVIREWQPAPELGLHALLEHARISLGAAPVERDLLDAAAAALAGADAALDSVVGPWWEPTEDVAELLTIGMGLLLHRDLHADVAWSPLSHDPDGFLAPVRASRAMQLLAAPVGAPRPGPRSRTVGGRRRVVVLGGAYPRFSLPVVELLRGERGVEVEMVDLGAECRDFRWLGTDPELVRLRLLASIRGGWPAAHERCSRFSTPGVPSFTPSDATLRTLQKADVVLADWADKGAVWASLICPPRTDLVVRAHGMDALSIWPHLIDWSRVNAVVTVSPHHAALMGEVLRHSGVGQSQSTRLQCRVVPNLVTLPELRVAPSRELTTIGLVGWGKRVKDPIWAVDLLGRLRARGGDWRLRLIGDGFAPGGVGSSREYSERFVERCARPDVAGAVEQVPQTTDVAREVARLGFIVSSSVRESFHQGLLEGVLGGAVPVVRDWPFYSRQGGASRLYPGEWVVTDVDAAVERIWSLRDETAWLSAAHRAGAEATRRFGPETVNRALLDAVLGV